MNPQNALTVSTAGRICLFGEHQDYLGLPVIAAAISLRVYISGEKTDKLTFKIDLPDVKQQESFDFSDAPVAYARPRDYFRSAFNVLRRKGLTFSKGAICNVNGKIPIDAGTSSSSALMVAWLHFLVKTSDQSPNIDTKTLGEWAYEAEVLEFGEPIGMMDQYSTAIGRVIYLESEPQIAVTPLVPKLGKLVLINSMQPKDPFGNHLRIKKHMKNIRQKYEEKKWNFSLAELKIKDFEMQKMILTKEERQILGGTLRNRNICQKAKKMLENDILDDIKFGKLLQRHQQYLRDDLRLSTPKIDKILEKSLEVGALGGKINGSGSGGCVFVYAPTRAEQVVEAMREMGCDAWLVEIGDGTKMEF